MNKTIKYGIRNAPPPFSRAVNGNRHTFPRPTDIAMQDIRNSISLPHDSRWGFVMSSVVAVGVMVGNDIGTYSKGELVSKIKTDEIFGGSPVTYHLCRSIFGWLIQLMFVCWRVFLAFLCNHQVWNIHRLCMHDYQTPFFWKKVKLILKTNLLFNDQCLIKIFFNYSSRKNI